MFEIVFKYYKKSESGKFDVENSYEFKKKIGTKDEDIPLEKVASLITANLARRDVWIHDVSVYEYAKKQITFRESKDGIILKNKKFGLIGNQVEEVLSFDEDVDACLDSVDEVPAYKKQAQIQQVYKNKNVKCLRYEIFGADPDMPPIKGFTKNSKYPIIKEITSGMKGEVISAYIVVNDNGMETRIDPVYFTSENSGRVIFDGPVFNDRQPAPSQQNNIIYGGPLVQGDMPVLRRGS